MSIIKSARKIFRTSFLLTLVTFTGYSYASLQRIPDPPNINAVGYILLDMHSGQVAFPGGGAEPGDETPEATALRESNEEIGLHPEHTHILGRLGTLHTISNYVITPVVAVLDWPQILTPFPLEVSRIFTIPLEWLVNARNHHVEPRTLPGEYSPAQVIYFHEYDGEILWGATASITLHLFETLGLTDNPGK